MNIFTTKFAKLAILGGCGLRILVPCLSMLEFLFSISFSILSNIINVIAFLLIAGGFALLFLLEQKIIDLAIGGAFALTALPSFMVFLTGIGILRYTYSMSVTIGAIAVIVDLFATVALFLWAFKLFKGSNQMAAIAVVGSFILSFSGGFFSSFGLESAFIYMAYIASNGALAYAAFLDYINT